MDLLMLLFLLLGGPSGIQGVFHTLEGLEFRGELKEWDPSGKFVIQTGEELKPLNVENLYAVYFDRDPDPKPRSLEAGLMFQDGSFLGGIVEGGDVEEIFFTHPDLGRLEIAIDSLAALLLAGPALPKDFDRYRRLDDDDVLYKKHEGARAQDHIQGILVGFASKGLTFDCALGELTFAFDELEALTLARPRQEKARTGRPITIILRRNSGLVKGIFHSLRDEVLRLDTLFQEQLSIPLKAVDSMLLEGERFTFLSDLSPTSVEETPYIGDGESFLYPHRRDRSVTGEGLSSMGRKFVKGLGLHSRTSLTYALDGKYLALEAMMGLSDEVLALPAKGSVEFAVRVDGDEVYRSPVIRGGDRPSRTPRIPLKGASTLTVTVDFADGFDSGDRAVLGNPILLKDAR